MNVMLWAHDSTKELSLYTTAAASAAEKPRQSSLGAVNTITIKRGFQEINYQY